MFYTFYTIYCRQLYNLSVVNLFSVLDSEIYGYDQKNGEAGNEGYRYPDVLGSGDTVHREGHGLPVVLGAVERRPLIFLI